MCDAPNLAEAHDWPLYWLAALGRAIDESDLEGAAMAVAELRRLGIVVSCQIGQRTKQTREVSRV